MKAHPGSKKQIKLLDTAVYWHTDNLTMSHSTCIIASALAGKVADSGERKALGAIL
jgi:hypothetical protein